MFDAPVHNSAVNGGVVWCGVGATGHRTVRMMCECREPPQMCTVIQKQTHTHRNIPDTRKRKLKTIKCAVFMYVIELWIRLRLEKNDLKALQKAQY